MSILLDQDTGSITTKRLPRGEETIDYDMSFTRNASLISQYKILRNKLYKIDPRFIGFRIFKELTAENYEDPDDQMLILHKDNICYGGACLRISTPEHPVKLDLESDISPATDNDSFSLQKQFPEMQLKNRAYAEFNRIVLHPSLRKGEATRRIFQAVLSRCIAGNVQYMFGIGDKVRTRLYRQIYNKIGLESFIREDLDIPLLEEYEGTKMYLLAGNLKNFYQA